MWLIYMLIDLVFVGCFEGGYFEMDVIDFVMVYGKMMVEVEELLFER